MLPSSSLAHTATTTTTTSLHIPMEALKKKYEDYQGTYEQLSTKYENAIKEKMLMKLERDRLASRVAGLGAQLRQIEGGGGGGGGAQLFGDYPTAEGELARLGPGRTWTGPGMMVVRQGETATFPLAFCPTWACQMFGKLVLTNAQSGDTFEFRLMGVGEEPLAAEHVELECRARETITHNFAVPNTGSGADGGATFDVESDIAHVSGLPSIEVGEGETGDYELTFHPLLGGTYSGSITFKNQRTGHFVWYTVSLEVESPEAEDTLELKSFVRQAVSVDVSLSNPLNKAVEFDVTIKGEGLLGDPTLTLGPKAEATYELLFSPLLPGVEVGSVVFGSAQLGEVWYSLNLTAEPAPPVQLPEVRCAVGSTKSQPLVLENPTGNQVTLRGTVTNRTNFALDPPVVTLEPYEAGQAMLEYTPSSLDVVESTTVVFKSARLGEWVFEASGRGGKPSNMPPVEVTASVGTRISSSFLFRNPFAQALHVRVTQRADAPGALEEGESNRFELLMKRPDATVPAFGTLQVPFSYAPQRIEESRATIDVSGTTDEQEAAAAAGAAAGADGGGLRWVFPLRGVAEAARTSRVIRLSCKARERAQELVELELEGVAGPGGRDSDGSELTAESFRHELVVPEGRRPFIERALTVVPLALAPRSSTTKPNSVIVR